MLTIRPFPRAVLRAGVVAAVAGATALTTLAVPAAATPSTSPAPTPTVSRTPRPVVSPWAGPLTTPCPASAATHPTPLLTTGPSSQPTTPAAGPIGGPLMGDTGTEVRSGPGVPALPDITASSWVVADADTGQVLAAKDPHGEFLPASTLKTLTAVTLIPRLDPCGVYTATKADLHAECTCVGVADGTAYRIRMLLTGMLVVSGNDAADTLAGAYGGVDKTVAAMNAEAHYLKAYDTHAGTPSGLDAPHQESSAYDLALIARAGLGMADFRGYVGTRSAEFTMPKGEVGAIYTHDKLLLNYPGAIGIKNGFTDAAQATYIGAATRNGHTLIATLMHSTVGTAVWHEDAALLDWGFAALGKVAPVGQLVDPDLPPAPTTSAAATSAATATSLAPSASLAPTSVLRKLVAASVTRKASATGTSVALPLSVAAVLFVAAAAVLATLQRRRRRRRGRVQIPRF